MAISATMSAYSLYNYDATLFDELHLPDGVDKDTIIENFLTDSIELELLYPEPETFKAIIGIWSRKRIDTWNHFYKLLNDTDYNPIWNVDGTVSSTYGKRETDLTSDPVTTSENLGKTHSTAKTGERNGTNSSKVSAYNSNDLVPASGSESHEDSAIDEANTDAIENVYNAGKQHSNSQQKEVTDTVTRTGNIGVTTTQSMINEELELRNKYNIYDYIVNDMIKRFCLLVY